MRRDIVNLSPNFGGRVASELPRRLPRITFESRCKRRDDNRKPVSLATPAHAHVAGPREQIVEP
jgi:hypothetical protein